MLFTWLVGPNGPPHFECTQWLLAVRYSQRPLPRARERMFVSDIHHAFRSILPAVYLRPADLDMEASVLRATVVSAHSTNVHNAILSIPLEPSHLIALGITLQSPLARFM